VAPIRVVLVIALGLAASRASAEAQPALEVAWTGGEGEAGCARPERLEEQVRELAAGTALGFARAPAQFQVQVESVGQGRYRLSVSRTGAGDAGSRELASCSEAREAAIVIMATALGDEADDSAPAPGAPPAAGADENAPPSADIVAEMGVSPRFTLTLAALLDYGTLPGIGVGPMLDVGYANGLLRAGVSARYLPAREAPDVPAGASMHIDSYGFGVHGAALFRFATTAFGPRAELELGALRGRARGVEDAVTRRTFWCSLLLGAELEAWFHSRVGAQLFVLAGPALSRPRFALEDSAAVYTTGRLVLRGGLGVTVRIDPTD
jgi:hypothetical protein